MEKKYTKLEETRKQAGFTHQEMADKLGICKAYYWQIESGKRRLYYKLAKKISAIFNLKPDDLFYEDDSND